MSMDAKLGLDLFSLDVLPPRSAVDCQLRIEPDGDVWVRFRMVALRRVLRDRRSSWSGWFLYDGERIALRWETFWP